MGRVTSSTDSRIDIAIDESWAVFSSRCSRWSFDIFLSCGYLRLSVDTFANTFADTFVDTFVDTFADTFVGIFVDTDVPRHFWCIGTVYFYLWMLSKAVNFSFKIINSIFNLRRWVYFVIFIPGVESGYRENKVSTFIEQSSRNNSSAIFGTFLE